jgi:hypothetical protein
LNVDTEITPNKGKKRAAEKSDSDSGIDEAKRLKTEKMWDEMMFNDDWTLNQIDSKAETKTSKVHSCPHCDYTSKFINNLGRHIRKRHGSSATLKVKIKSEPKSNTEGTLNQNKNVRSKLLIYQNTQETTTPFLYKNTNSSNHKFIKTQNLLYKSIFQNPYSKIHITKSIRIYHQTTL